MMFPDADKTLVFDKLLRRRKPLRNLVIHWTGAENSAQKVFRTLKRRDLSVDFIIDWDGKTYMCNPDPLRYRTSHAGNANSYSVGVEVVNYGTRRLASEVPQHKIAQKHRPLTLQTIHGKQRFVADFFPEQVKALKRLVWGVGYHLDIETAFPTKPGTRQIQDTVIDWRSFEGVLGHFHVSGRKTDPGTAVLQELQDTIGVAAC